MFELRKLLATQKDFADTVTHKPKYKDYVFAMNIEISEFMNCLPWKWWKKQQNTNKERVLDELADVLAFWLSYYIGYFAEYRKMRILTPEESSEDIERMTDLLQYHLNAIHKPTRVADLSDFNYPSSLTMTNITFSGFLISKLCSYAMYYTNCSILEIIDAYHKKMVINHERQKTNY